MILLEEKKKRKKKGPTNKQGTTIYIQKNFVDQCLFCQFVGIALIFFLPRISDE